MSAAWAVRFDQDERCLVGQWRLIADVEVCEASDGLWLRGPDTEPCRAQLERLPIGQRHAIRPDLQLVPHGALVPQGHLPREQWRPLKAWLALELPVAAVAAPLDQQVRLELVRDERERVPNVLLTTATDWASFAGNAAQVRLSRLRFAIAEDGRVAIVGSPLPAMPGVYYCELDGIAVPAGWLWSPPVDAEVLRELLCLGRGDLALLGHDGDWEILTADNFVPASRAAARASVEHNDA